MYFIICQWAGFRYLLVGGAIILSLTVILQVCAHLQDDDINDSHLCECMNEEHDHRPLVMVSLLLLLPVVSVAGRRHEEESQPKFTALLVERSERAD